MRPTLNTNIPSEKLVKDSLDLKADITPANGSTSALRALFIARGMMLLQIHIIVFIIPIQAFMR